MIIKYSVNHLIRNCFLRNTVLSEIHVRSRRIPSLSLVIQHWIFRSFWADFRLFSGYSEAILAVKPTKSPENSLNIPQMTSFEHLKVLF